MSKVQKIRIEKIGKVALVSSLFILAGTVLCVGQQRHPRIADSAEVSGIENMVVTAKRLPSDDAIQGIVVTAKRERQLAEISGGRVRSAR